MARKPTRKSTAKLWKSAKNPNQKYRDRISLTLADGTVRELVGYGATKREATDALYAKVDAIVGKISPRTHATVTLDDVMQEYLEYGKQHKGWSPTTQATYSRIHKHVLQPSLGNVPIKTLSVSQIRDALQPHLEQHMYRSCEMACNLLKATLRWLEDDYPDLSDSLTLSIRKVPTIKRPKGYEFEDKPIWSEEQVRMFLEYLRVEYEKCISGYAYVYYSVALMAGLRGGEITGLRRNTLVCIPTGGNQQWFLEIRRQITFLDGNHYETVPKSSAGIRDVPIPQRLVDILLEHQHRVDQHYTKSKRYKPNDLMIPNTHGKPLWYAHVAQCKNRAIKALGLPQCHNHHMRKIYTTHLTRQLIAKGIYSPKLVSRILGHSNTKLAMQVYTKTIDTDFASAVIDFYPTEADNRITSG
jgi:integrase